MKPALPGPDLSTYSARDFSRGRSRAVEALWIVVEALFVASWFPGSRLRAVALRAFGARIGRGVVLKPGLRVKFPWRLEIGSYSWIGERAWIDNLAEVEIGQHAVLSQDVYVCTGSHRVFDRDFALITKRIVIGNHAWVCARAVIGPGVEIGEGAVLALGSVATSKLEEWTIYRGNPAQQSMKRVCLEPKDG